MKPKQLTIDKRAIKIVKRKDLAEKTEVVRNAVEVAGNAQPRLANAVNRWISERRVNNRTEKIFSDNKILGWKTMPEPIEETFG